MARPCRAVGRQHQPLRGPYFKHGFRPVNLIVEEEFDRAAPLGTGHLKVGGNYAASLVPQAEGIENGCDQVVFLDAVEKKWIEELGGMNLFFVFDDGRVITPKLTGTILPGITRDSVIEIVKDWGIKMSERSLSIDEVIQAAKNSRLKEAFGTGTAAVISRSPPGFIIA